MAEKKVSFYDIIDIYDAYEFPEILGGNTNSVALAILRVWNRRYRPRSFRLTNKELIRRSGVPSHIDRHRTKIIKECVINEEPLFEYESRGKNLAGIYTIHTEVIPDKNNHDDMQRGYPSNNTTIVPEQSQYNTTQTPISDQVRTESEQNTPENGNDLREEKRREEKESLSTTPNVVTTSSKEVATLSAEEEKRYWAIVGLMKKACPSWHPSNDFIRDRVESMILDYPDHQIEIVIARAGTDGVRRTAFLGFIERGLQNFEKYYGNQANAQPPEQTLQEKLDIAIKELEDYKEQISDEWDNDEAVQDYLASLQDMVDFYKQEIENATDNSG